MESGVKGGLTASMTSLKHIQRPPHVPLGQFRQRLRSLLRNIHRLLLHNPIHQHPNIPLLQRTKPKPCAPRQQRRRQLMRIIRNNAEPRVGRVLLHDPPQRHLRRRRHRVRLIQDDQFVRRHRLRPGLGQGGEDLPRAGEGLDLLAYDVDAAVVGGVELENHLSHVFDAVDAPGQREDGGGLAGAGGAVEEEVGESVGFDEAVDGGDDVLVTGDVFEGVGAVFFDPGGRG